MDILQYNDLDLSKIKAAFDRTVEALRSGDFRAADVKKLKGTPFYRAKLNDADRLLFRFGNFAGKTYLLLLEIIRNHAYEKSRFLGGAPVSESKLLPVPKPEPLEETDSLPLPYVNPAEGHFHVLDKILSFDDVQAGTFRMRPPLILIGAAGSGKTVLTLEKLKGMRGDVLYVTLSAFLAENARDLYYSFGYENENQNLDFLSLKEYVETLRVPEGRSLTYGAFAAWFARHGHGSRIKDPHMLFEEFNGVLTGMPVDRPHLDREEYVNLGIRQSIFLAEERQVVYDLFLRYKDWLKESEWYDPNLIAYDYLPLCDPRYDFVVVDEVQDITNIQLHLILKSLRSNERFVLCGDSNQIVHPNFFSWAKVKTLFYERRVEGQREIIRVLNANYRNSPEVTDLANRLLLVKNARFGSIDRESNYLVQPVSDRTGTVELARDDPKSRTELDKKTHRSTRYAVLVMRTEDKEDARKHFRTPLLFSIQEAKGLEYENIILLNFVSRNAKEFHEIVDGVSSDAVKGELRYARAKDKSDKSMEAYKFYTNALYVALTRAISNVYILETRPDHRIWDLLGLRASETEMRVKAEESSTDDWKEEARRLEMQGKAEQAEAIRRTILETQEVPWRVLNPETLEELKKEALNPNDYNRQAKLLLFDYALIYHVPYLFRELVRHNFKKAATPFEQLQRVEAKYQKGYQDPKFAQLQREIGLYGVDFRNPLNQTPLMIAAQVGKADLAASLIRNGAHREAIDNWGRMPLHIALRQAYRSKSYARKKIGELYALLAPSSLKVKVEGRMIKIDQKLMEFFVLHSMIAIFQDIARVKTQRDLPAFETADFVHSLQYFPEHVIPERRKKRAYLSSIFSKNEINRQDRYNRKLFLRVRHGQYILSPLLELEVQGQWINVYDLIGISALEQENEDTWEDRALQSVLKLVRIVQEEHRIKSDLPEGALNGEGSPIEEVF